MAGLGPSSLHLEGDINRFSLFVVYHHLPDDASLRFMTASPVTSPTQKNGAGAIRASPGEAH